MTEDAQAKAPAQRRRRRPQPEDRRTQAERSSATRQRVCEATLQVLAEVGYERLSTTLVAQKAKVSRGALTHQFPMRNDLLVAAFAHLVDIWGEGYPFGEDPAVTRLTHLEMIDAIWENIFDDRRYIAALELMLAARLDNELGLALREVMVRWLNRRDTKAVELLGYKEPSEEDAMFIQMTLSVLRGIAVHRTFDPDETVSHRLVEIWKNIARQVDPKVVCKTPGL